MAGNPQKAAELMFKIQQLCTDENIGLQDTTVALISAIVWLNVLNCQTKEESDKFLYMARKDLFNGIKSRWSKAAKARETIQRQTARQPSETTDRPEGTSS